MIYLSNCIKSRTYYKDYEKRRNYMNTEINIFIKKRRIRTLLLGVVMLILFLIVIVINIPEVLKYIISIAIMLVYLFRKIAIDMKLIRMFDYILCDDCDSIQYYEICKKLNTKYPKNYIILEAYTAALRYNLSDLKEKEFLLNKYQKYKENLFYLNLQIDVVPESNKKDIFYKFYKRSRLFNEKKFKKNRGYNWDYNIKTLDMKKMIFEKKYEKAIGISKTILDCVTKLNEIQLEFLRGVCYYHLNEFDEAIEKFKYVISEGNTLKMVSEAREYLNKISTNSSH